MNLGQAFQLADKKLTEFKAIYPQLAGWKWGWNNNKTSYGKCYYGRKTLELSMHLIPHSSDANTLNTILHEIAHAIAGSSAGHGWKWKNVARQIGCNAQRCGGQTETLPPSPYVHRCPVCQNKTPRYRKVSRSYSCTKCNPRRYDARYKLVFERA